MKKRVVSLLVCACMCAAMLAGCGDKPSDNAGSTAAEPKSESAASSASSAGTSSQPEKADAEKSDIKIGFAMKTLDNSYFVSLVGAVEELAAAEGWECTTLNANMDSTKEAENMETFITQGMDLIFLDSVDPTACVPSINAAAEADIPVVNLDSGVAECEQCTTIYADNYQNGRMLAWPMEKQCRRIRKSLES